MPHVPCGWAWSTFEPYSQCLRQIYWPVKTMTDTHTHLLTCTTVALFNSWSTRLKWNQVVLLDSALLHHPSYFSSFLKVTLFCYLCAVKARVYLCVWQVAHMCVCDRAHAHVCVCVCETGHVCMHLWIIYSVVFPVPLIALSCISFWPRTCCK